MDALAYEGHFLDHLAPLWRALDPRVRGRFLVAPELVGRAEKAGIEPDPVRVDLRQPPAPDAQRLALVASYGDLKKGRRLGFGTYAYLEHGIGQSYGNGHGSYAGGMDRADVGLFLVPNVYSAELWNAAYPAAEVKMVGSPKLDTLPAREPGPGPVIALAFHWPCGLVPETMPAFHHVRAAFPQLVERFKVLGHGHPRGLANLARHYRRGGIEVVEDFEEVCRRADLLIADNTSVMYEFAATGRPVVVVNAPGYRRHVKHGLRFWEAATVGVQVDGPGELLAGVELALADPPEVAAARETALDLVYAWRSGAAERAARAIERWAGLRAEAA